MSTCPRVYKMYFNRDINLLFLAIVAVLTVVVLVAFVASRRRTSEYGSVGLE
jgi:hypothetical protein